MWEIVEIGGTDVDASQHTGATYQDEEAEMSESSQEERASQESEASVQSGSDEEMEIGVTVDPVRKAFLNFTRALKVTRVCPSKPFNKLSPRSLRHKVQMKLKIMNAVDRFMAPDFEEVFREKTKVAFCDIPVEIGEESYGPFLRQIAEQYLLAVDRNERKFILSTVAGSVSYGVMLKYFNGLPKREYTMARRRALHRQPLKKENFTREKYDIDALHAFLDFITRF